MTMRVWYKNTPKMNSLVETCIAFRPGVLDEYDKETRSIMSELKGLLTSDTGVSQPDLSNSAPNLKALTSLSPSGPGPPVSSARSTKSQIGTAAMESVMNTILTRDSFSEHYIGAMRKDMKTVDDGPSASKSNKVQKPKNQQKQKRRLGATTKTGLENTTSGNMADLTSPLDTGPLAVSTEDGSIRKFSILPPIETSATDHARAVSQTAQDSVEKDADPRADLDPNDPANFGWHISSIERLNAAQADASNKSSDKLGTLTNAKLPLRPSVPSTTTYITGNKTGSSELQPVDRNPLDAGSVSNSYASMSALTSGTEELKKHLKQRQQQRAVDQKDFKGESVNGRPLNQPGTYMIKYGNVEVPTTDVELYAILSVEKHNSPFANEYDSPDTETKDVDHVPDGIPEKIEKKLANLVEKEQQELSELRQRDLLHRPEFESQENQDDDDHADSPDPNFPLVHISKIAAKDTNPKVGQLILADTRAKRRLKGQLYKCYDTKTLDPRAPYAAREPVALKPLVSMAPHKEVVVRTSKDAEVVQPTLPHEEKSDRRNIFITLPMMTRDDDSTSYTTSHETMSLRDEFSPHGHRTNASAPSNRQPYLPPKVTLGNTKSAVPLSELPTSAHSTGSFASGKSRKSLTRRDSQPETLTDDDGGAKKTEAHPPDAVDLEMQEKMLTVMGANLALRSPSAATCRPVSNQSARGLPKHAQEGSACSPQSEPHNDSSNPSRATPPVQRISTALLVRKSQSEEKHLRDSRSGSRLSVSSDPVDSRTSSARLRADAMPHSGKTPHGVLPSGDRLSSSRSSSNSCLSASARGAVGGSFPELPHPGSMISSMTTSSPGPVPLQVTQSSTKSQTPLLVLAATKPAMIQKPS